MKNIKLISSILLGSILVFAGFTSLDQYVKPGRLMCSPMLWNNHITKRSWIYVNQDEQMVYKEISDITDGDNLKMPKNRWDAKYTDSKTKNVFNTPDQTNASFKFVTLGYKMEDIKKNVGFDFLILNKNKKKDDPYIFRIVNNSQKVKYETVGDLREVGFVFDNWPQYWEKDKVWTGGQHSFSDNYQIEKLDNLIVKFKIRLINYNTPINKNVAKEKWLGSYVTCDFRFNEYSTNGKLLNSYLLGVVFSNPLKVDFNGNDSDHILFGSTKKEKDGTTYKMLLLHGSKVGIKEINTIDSKNNFQTVEIDFKPLLEKYYKINKNNTNIVTGLDIYSATRGVDLTYDIQDLQMTGCKRD